MSLNHIVDLANDSGGTQGISTAIHRRSFKYRYADKDIRS